MNIIDIILIIPLAFAVINGFRKGFIIEIASLIAFFVAIIACLEITHKFMVWLTGFTGPSKWLPFICYILVFVAAYLFVMWLGKLLETAIKIVQLGLINRLFGVAFSLMKMCFFISLFFWLADLVHLIPKSTENQSFTYKTLNHFSIHVISWVSERVPWVKGEIEEIENFFGGTHHTVFNHNFGAETLKDIHWRI